MIILSDPGVLYRIKDDSIRQLLSQRFIEITEGVIDDYDPDVNGVFVLIENGDTVASIESNSEAWICSSPFNKVCYGEPGFVPAFELLEEHPSCYEMVFVVGGDYGVVLIIPKDEEIDAELIQFCADYATPAPESLAA